MTTNQKLLDWLDDLCVRFIVNLPHEELQSVERICFQIEEAQWFYEDFIRPLDPNLPSMNLRVFSQRMFQHCPLFAGFTAAHREGAYEQFLQYKTRVPVRGAIMLNQEMTHAVLVKGWKKGAKWSFPRGKINKDESDLDCAVREVYEETGLDLQEAGLVLPEEQMKSIDVTMREQSLKLYVFRGVPMDTNFEPRTRKEISKIDWYKLSDLPTLRRKNHPQGNGNDLKDNSFYMVTPFIPQLKGWIKSQRQLEKRNQHAGAHLPAPAVTGVTDTELEGDFGDTTADEAPIPDFDADGANFANLVANLGRSQHRASDALPEVQFEQSTADPAAELKRLLSVGGGFLHQGQMVETPPIESIIPPSNPLFEMLQASNKPSPIPRTPFDQIVPNPQMPQSPHGQHHPRQPHFEHMPPPPHFPFRPTQGHHFQGPQHHPHMPHQPHMPPQSHNGFPPQLPPQFFPPPQHQQSFPPHLANMQQQFTQQPPRQFVQADDPSFAPPQGFQNQRGPAVPPASKLPAPKLTTHTMNLLNSFKISEKPAVMSPQTPREILQQTPKMAQPPALHRDPDSFLSSPGTHSANPYAPSPPAFVSPPVIDNVQPAQPRPRNAHQTSLLSLFQSPSLAAATPELSQPDEPPAELSAFPTTPGLPKIRTGSNAMPPMPNMNAKPNLSAAPPQQNRPGNTSATVRAPVNAPDFDTVKKNTHLSSARTSRGPSPANSKVEQKMFVPQQILKREGTPKNAGSSSRRSPHPAAAPGPAFKPQILKRPQQPDGAAVPLQAAPPSSELNTQVPDLISLFKSYVPPPTSTQVPAVPTQHPAAPPASGSSTHAQGLLGLFKSSSPAPQVPTQQPTAPTAPSHQNRSSSNDPTTSAPPHPAADQKQALLSLFNTNKPSPSPQNPVEPPLTQSPAPIPHALHSPPTAKHAIGFASPVSPLPAGTSLDSHPNLLSRSRISSIGEPSFPIPGQAAAVSSVSAAPGMSFRAAPPTSHPQAQAHNGVSLSTAAASGGAASNVSGPAADDAGLMFDPRASVGSARSAGTATTVKAGEDAAKSPVDKTFLLGFLNDFAKKGR